LDHSASALIGQGSIGTTVEEGARTNRTKELNGYGKDKSFAWRRTEDASALELEGARALVIGGTGGVGRALSRALARHGASVVVVGRTFRDKDVPGIEFVEADLSLMSEANRIAGVLPSRSPISWFLRRGSWLGPNGRKRRRASSATRQLPDRDVRNPRRAKGRDQFR